MNMKHQEIVNLVRSSPNDVWSVLTKAGLELVTQMRLESKRVFDSSGSQEVDILFTKPYQVRALQVPEPTERGIHIQVQPQMQPLLFFMQCPELPVDAVDIWAITSAPKKISDLYLQANSRIILGT